MGIVVSRTFKNGNGIAARLGIDPSEEKQKLLDLIDELDALPRPDQVEKHEPIEFPDRPGL